MLFILKIRHFAISSSYSFLDHLFLDSVFLDFLKDAFFECCIFPFVI